MSARPMRLVLAGGGHCHVERLRRLQLQPGTGIDLAQLAHPAAARFIVDSVDALHLHARNLALEGPCRPRVNREMRAFRVRNANASRSGRRIRMIGMHLPSAPPYGDQ